MKNNLRVVVSGYEYWGQEGGYVFLENSRTGRIGTLGQQVTDGNCNCLSTPGTEAELVRKLRNIQRREKRAMECPY